MFLGLSSEKRGIALPKTTLDAGIYPLSNRLCVLQYLNKANNPDGMYVEEVVKSILHNGVICFEPFDCSLPLYIIPPYTTLDTYEDYLTWRYLDSGDMAWLKSQNYAVLNETVVKVAHNSEGIWANKSQLRNS